MFLEYYGLREQAFGVTPDPRFIYFGPSHREALASLLYAIETKRGFSAMVAEPGMGKTSLLFRLLESLRDSARTAFLFQTNGDSKELLRSLLSDLGIKTRGKGIAAMHDDLNRTLIEEMQAGRKMVVVIDEAQNLDESALETIRLLSNFETATEKMMHIVLAGQPKLADTLASADLVQLRQRVSTIIRLEPFRLDETAAYIQFRLKAAGYQGPPIFTSDAVSVISRLSKGIPRNINSICFQALSIGFASQTKVIGPEILREVATDLDFAAASEGSPAVAPEPSPPTPPPPTPRPTPRSSEQERWPAAWPEPRPPRRQSFSGADAPPPFEWRLAAPSVQRYEVRGMKGLATILAIGILVAAIVVFSDPSLGLTNTPPGRLSVQLVNAILSSGDSNSDFLPSSPNSLKAPVAPPIETTRDRLVADSTAQTDSSAPDDVGGVSTQPNDATSDSPTADPAPGIKKSKSANGERTDADSDDAEYLYRGPSRVQVQRRENLFQFALENIGRSNWPIVEKICEMNPQIRGPYDMLSAGQWIQLPSAFPSDVQKSGLHAVASTRQR